MKLKPINNLIALIALSAGSYLHAGVFSDNFSSAHDYLNNGVAGTPWTGISLGAVNPGTVSRWDAGVSEPGTLTITNAGGAWVDGGDGPYLWTMVHGSGDFTNTVHVSALSTVNYNFAGLLVRSPDASNGANWLYVSMFPEYSVGIDVRDTTNGVSQEFTYAPSGYSDADTNTWPGWLQITRVAGVLTCNVSVDGVTWNQAYVSPRTDLTSDLQVGVYNSTYSDNVCWAKYQNFTLVGPDVATNVVPNVATGLTLTPAVNSLNIAWTNGAGTAGSVVVVRMGLPVTRQPVDGTNYTGSAVFGAGVDLGESNYVAYAGSGTSVTLTNVIPTVPYTVAVYSYRGTGTSTLYAISNAPVATAASFGVPTGISISYGNTNAVATDDTIQPTITLHFTGGGSTTVTANTILTAGNTNLASVSAGNLVAGLAPGTVAMTATYQTFTTTSNLTVIKLPVTDDFSTPRDYLTQGLPGTSWDGLLLSTNDIPVGGTAAGPTTTLVANAGITKAGRLTISAHDSGFNVGADSGVFLYRVISGDFSISVQVTSFDTPAYHMPGLMVRAPFEMAFTENFLQWISFNEFSIGNFARRALSGAYAENYKQAGAAQPYLMIQRQTNTFNYYQKAHALDPWTLIATEDHPEFDGVAMQVGLVDQTFTANTGTAEFDNLLFTVPNAVTNNAPAGATNLVLASTALGSVTANWTRGTGSTGSIVVAHPYIPGTRQPTDGSDFSTTANADLALGVDMGGSNIVVFAGTGSSVVITDLPPVHYCFAVYSYKTVNGTNYYNIVSVATNSVDVLGMPAIYTQPVAAITRYVGKSVSLTASASIGAYRWQLGGVDVINGARISGATTSTLTISNLTAADSGNYTFIVTNILGAVTSAPPTVLTVLTPTNSSELSVLADSPAGFWRLNETSGTTAYDYVGGFDGVYDPSDVLGVNGPLSSDGFPHFEAGNLAVQFLGNSSASVVTLPALTPATELVSNLTITAWINPSSYPADREAVVSFNAPANTGLRMYGGTTGLSILYNNTVSHTGLIPPLNQWSFVAMVITPTGATFYLANSGGWQVYSDTTARAAISLSGAGYIGSDRAIAGRYYEGIIDEVGVYKSAISGTSVTNLFNGVVAPPAVSLGIQKSGSSIQLSWSQGTLLEATNLMGPWVTNTASSPYTPAIGTGNKFYRVRVQ